MAMQIQIASAQFVTNNNLAITIENGLQVTMNGDIQNQNATTINNNGTIYLDGNWINNTNNNCFGTSQGTVIFKGNNQTIGGSTTTAFNNIILQNSGTKTLLTDISAGGNYAVPSGTLDAGNSVLDLNSKTLFVTNSSTNAVTAATGYILSEDVDNSSKINWTINNTNGAHTIPFGNTAGALIPLTFNLTSGNAGAVTFSTYATSAINLPLPILPLPVTHVRNNTGADNSANTVDRFWQIDVTGNPTASLTFTYAPTENAANTNVNMIAQRWINSTSGWSLPLSGQSNPTTQSVLVNNVTTFGPWAVASVLSPLPIQLLQFTATPKNKNVVCQWSTASEINNAYFTVEKSKDASSFEYVGVVNGQGNSSTIQNYALTDTNPFNNISYYRLKQTDYNGNFTYSEIKVVNMVNNETSISVSVFPNPVADFLNIVATQYPLQISIADATGKTLKEFEMNEANFKIDFTAFAQGIYYVNCSNQSGERNIQKVVKF